MCCKKM